MEDAREELVPAPRVQVEYYKDGFGWVLAVDECLPQMRRFRYRYVVPGGTWVPWAEVTASLWLTPRY
jgi:hypothetical protein